MRRLVASYKEIFQFNNDQQVREKRTGGSRKYVVGSLKVPRAQKIRIELLCVTPPDLFDNPARHSGIIRVNRLYSDHTSNSVEADTSRAQVELVSWRTPIVSGTRQSSEISFREARISAETTLRRWLDMTILPHQLLHNFDGVSFFFMRL